jgi:hypothetical protein
MVIVTTPTKYIICALVYLYFRYVENLIDDSSSENENELSAVDAVI